MRHLNVDIETFSSVDIRKSGMYKYVQSPDFEVLLFAYSLDGQDVQIVDLAQGERLPDDLVTALFDPSVIKHAYNAPFEWYCLSKMFELDTNIYAPINTSKEWLSQWRCTMLHGLYCGYTAGLGATAVALGLPEDKRKMGVGSSLIRTFCVPCKPTNANGQRTRTLPHHEPDKWKLFKTYCVQDVVTEMEIERRLSSFPVPEQEQQLWELDQQINAYGVAVDTGLVEGALHCDDVVNAELMDEAVKLSGLENPKSVKQLSKWLTEEMGEEITNLRKDTVRDLIKTTDEGSARRMLEIRQELSKTSVKKYTAMREAVCGDGRIRGLLQFYGANRTGRWAGRLVQVQNLPRNYLETLSHARDCVKSKKVEALKVVYGNVPDTLSQLIRTAFVPSSGNVFVVADFSAIEARVIAWLAGEQWRLEVFATHGKIYEASASQMFGVPLELIKKGNPEYDLRQKGKIAELALGYQGGPGALMAMDSKRELNEDELPDIVRRWRAANKRIVDLWYGLENAALDVMRTGQPVGIKGLVLARECEYRTQQDFLTITLPSGRKLFYARPFLSTNEKNREAIHYHGINQETKKWEVVPTYGGKLVENCLAGDTQVLTQEGWKRITDVQPTDLLWDGVEWVSHSGVVNKGVQITVELDGFRVTPEHLILTKAGWQHASSCEGHYRAPVSLPRSGPVHRLRRKEISLAGPVRLRDNFHNPGDRIFEGQTKVMRVHAKEAHLRKSSSSWHVTSSSVCCMALHDRPMSASITSGLAQLWSPRNQSLSAMGRKLRSILGGYGTYVSTWSNHRANRRERRLHSEQLLLGDIQTSGPKQTEQSNHLNAVGRNDGLRSGRTVRNWENDALLSSRPRMARKPFVLRAGRTESVYDILNAGPRHRFTVLGAKGPVIVHNCVQAIARDCLAESIKRLSTAGYRICTHIHDEVVLDVPAETADLNAVTDLMGQPVAWAPGLQLRADGFMTAYYKKD